jgi:hypothetical protein
MKLQTVVILAAGFVAATAADLRGQTCPTDAALSTVFAAGETVQPSGKIDRIRFESKTAGTPLGSGVSAHTLPWTPSATEITALKAVEQSAVAIFHSSTDAVSVCTRDFRVTTSGGGLGVVSGGARGTQAVSTNPYTILPVPSDCRAAGDSLSARISREQPGSDFTAVVFDAASQAVCYQNPDRPKFGGWIHVAVLTDDPFAWNAAKISLSPCSLQESKLSLFAPESLPTTNFNQSGEFVLRRFQPRRCYDATVNVTVENVPQGVDPKVSMRYELAQARRYHAALQVGVIFTNLHDHAFGLTRDGDTTRVYDKGPVRNGPEFTATILVYSLLNQVRGLLGGERYAGRELVADNSPLDRIGGVLGAGLNNPGDRFVAGLAYEAVPGINASVVWNTARVSRLVGIQPGTAFSGTEQQLPVQRQWRHDIAFGLSVDLTYATKLLGR